MKLKEKINGLLSLPTEIILDLPLIMLTGSNELNIENYKGIIEFTETKVRINTSSGVLMVEGKHLLLKQITAEGITVAGDIIKFEFLR